MDKRNTLSKTLAVHSRTQKNRVHKLDHEVEFCFIDALRPSQDARDSVYAEVQL